ncbi:MAG: PsiF family protein [Rhodanobacteraceae bacterium]
MLALTLSLAAFATAPAFAAAAKPMSAQQQKMADCSHQSKGMKGDAYKTFMSNCLKGKSDMAASGGKMSQQDKMKTCNATAKTKALKGSERKAFMSTCLKG